MDALSNTRPTNVESLTPRERECLLLVAEHLRSKQIARTLGLSPLTVDKYIASACDRLGVSSRHEAAQLVAKSGGVVAPPPPPPVDELVGSSLFVALLRRTRRVGQRVDRWEERRQPWVRTMGQLISLLAIYYALQVISRRALTLLSDVLPANLFASDFLGRAAAQPESLGSLIVGTYWDTVSSFALITLTLALWRGRLPFVVTGASILVGAYICRFFETHWRGVEAVQLVTTSDEIHTFLLVGLWTLYPRRWLALVVGSEVLMVAADFIVPSQPSMNSQLWMVSQGYLTVFTMLAVAVAAGAWPWAGARFRRFRVWLGDDLAPAMG